MGKNKLNKNKIGKEKAKLQEVRVKKKTCKMELEKEATIVEEEAKTLTEWWKKTTEAVMECMKKEEWKNMPGWKEEQEAERDMMKERAKRSRNIKNNIAVDI